MREPNRNKYSKLTKLVSAFMMLLGAAIAQCDAPPYRSGFSLADTKSETIISVSIRGSDFTPRKLKCLADTLNQRFQGRKKITVFVFSSYQAAKRWVYRPEAPTPENAELHTTLHAIYYYDSEKKEDYVRLIPNPGYSYLESSFDTKFDRQSVGDIHCTVELAGRCLLAVQPFGYPSTALRNVRSGWIKLSGNIGVSGKLKSVQVVEGDAAKDSELASYAMRNFATWKFEPTAKSSRVEIIYKFRIDEGNSSKELLQFEVPNVVIITGRP